MSARRTDADVVLGLVRRAKGLPGSWIAWRRGGGVVRNGEPEGTIEINFATMQKMLKVQQRLHELERRGQVYRSGPAVRTRTTGRGYYAVDSGAIASEASGVAIANEASNGAIANRSGDGRQRNDHGHARRVIGGLKELLG